MDNPHHGLAELFEQLGLPSDKESITSFFYSNVPLAGHIKLADAPFWSPQQAAFLRDGILKDADWAEIIDQLNTRLR